MAPKSTIVVSTKIPRREYEYLLARVKYLYKSNSIKNCTKASYMKYLIDNDLGDDRDRQYQNLMNMLDSPNLMRGLPGFQSSFPAILTRIKSCNQSVRIVGADSIPDSIPPCE
jgi:hypothetical protein